MIYHDWQVNEPSANQGCAASSVESALWTAQQCNSTKPFVCRIPAAIEVCDAGWSYFQGPNQNGMCYKYTAQRSIQFLNAQNACLSQGANLVSIHSKEENDYVSSLALVGTYLDYHIGGVFIGLQYINSEWVWLDGSKFDYQNWASNRPQYPTNTDTDGTFLYPDGADEELSQKWDDYSLGSVFNRYICKKKPNLTLMCEGS
uniref:C-type lectin domain-containing protein n=1 Tax=Panagrolaimus sp. JU765 TaxID=591449 RepID=A0AC34R2L0_9BILA